MSVQTECQCPVNTPTKILPQPAENHRRSLPPQNPAIVYVEPTNACNCQCSICPRQNMTRATGMMTMAKFRTIADQLAVWRPELRLFNFGEPLLHPQLAEMILYAQTKLLPTRVQTNGLLLDETHCRALVESGLEYIGISVNGLTENEYGAIRPGCRLADLKANVRLLRQIQAQLGKPAHIHINAQILAEEKNNRQADIKRFVAYWEGLPDSLSVSGISLFENVAVMEAGLKHTVRHSALSRKPPATIVCTEPFDRLVVKWDGRVTPCCADYDAQMVLGNVDAQSLAEIWEGPKLAALRQIVLEKRYASSSLCRSCPKLYSSEFTLLFKKNPRPCHPN